MREPALRYRELVARFGTSPAVVRSALKDGAGKWAGMLGKPVPEAIGGKVTEPVTKRDTWEHFNVAVRGRFADGDWVYETQEQGQADWTTTDAAVLADVLDGFGSDGWELAGVVAINHGHVGSAVQAKKANGGRTTMNETKAESGRFAYVPAERIFMPGVKMPGLLAIDDAIGMVLRVGEKQVAMGDKDAAIANYEHFIAGLKRLVLVPIRTAVETERAKQNTCH